MKNSQFLIIALLTVLSSGITYLLTRSRHKGTSSQPITLTPEHIRNIVGDAAREHLLAAQQTLREETDSRLNQNANALNLTNQQASSALTQLVAPLNLSIKSLDEQVKALEVARASAYSSLETQVTNTSTVLAALRTETTTLSHALRRSDTRGRWGELQVRRILEMAQLKEGVHFDEQKQEQGEGTGRPDFTIYLTGNRVLYVDSKAPMSAYLDALEETDPERRDVLFANHARALKTHVAELSKRRYADSEQSVDYVILFVPTESSLAAACESNPRLLEESAKSKVILASPTSLTAILCNVMMLWQHDSQNKNAQLIAENAKTLLARLQVFMGHFEKIGANLDRTGKAYDDAIGSFDRQVEPQARKVSQLGDFTDQIKTPEPINLSVRQSTKARSLESIDNIDGQAL